MMLDSETIHLASRNLMIAGFAIAALASAWRRNWGYLLVLLLAIVECHQRYRFKLHNWARESLLGVHEQIGDKEILQSKLIYVAGMLLVAVLLVLVPYLARADAGRRLTVLGSLTAITVFGLELISPHYVDQIIYHTVGLFALAAIVYFFSALLIALGAILARRPQRASQDLKMRSPTEQA